MSGGDDERRCTWTRLPSRQGELHGGARAGSVSSPYLAPVRFDDRPADRESHAHAAGLGGVEGVEQAVHTLRVQSRTRILHGDEHPARGVWPGADAQLARSLADAAHRFDGVEYHVQAHLLQLDAIALDARQALREVCLHRLSLWQGSSPAKTRASAKPSRAHGHHLRPSTNCYKLSEPSSWDG